MDVDEFLEHYGVRGMHWGVRKDRGSTGGTRIRTQRTFTGYYGSNNKNPLKGVGLNLLSLVTGAFTPLAAAVISPMSIVYHSSRREIKHEVKKINEKYTSPGHDIRTKKSLQAAYNKDIQKSISTAINRKKSGWTRPARAIANNRAGKHVNTKYDVDFYMTDNWNKAAYIVLTSPKGQTKDLRVGFAKHSDEDDLSTLHLEVTLPRDEHGLITDFIIPDLEGTSTLSQSDSVNEFLSHYGVRGMHWGVRRQRSSAGSSAPASKSNGKPPWQSPPVKKAVVPVPPPKKRFGKTKYPKILSEEAQQLHEIRLKAKRHGVHSLTNKELEIVNKRLDLQQKYQKAHPKKKNPVVDLVLDAVLSDQGANHIKKVLSDKNTNKNVINLVDAAININRLTRQKK